MFVEIQPVIFTSFFQRHALVFGIPGPVLNWNCWNTSDCWCQFDPHGMTGQHFHFAKKKLRCFYFILF